MVLFVGDSVPLHLQPHLERAAEDLQDPDPSDPEYYLELLNISYACPLYIAYPQGNERQLLNEIVDARGASAIRNEYSAGRVVKQLDPADDESRSAVQPVVISPDGLGEFRDLGRGDGEAHGLTGRHRLGGWRALMRLIGLDPGLRLFGTARDKAAVISFLVEGAHAHDLATLLDLDGIAVQAHEAQSLGGRIDR